MRRVLIFGTLYIAHENHLEACRLWIHLARHYHQLDWILVDAHSADHFIERLGVPRRPIREGIQPNTIVDLGDNIGHLELTRRDGWGRAFCTGLQFAIEAGYDYVVHMEGDLLNLADVTQTLDLMVRHGKKVAAPICPYVFGVETGLMYFDVEYLCASGFIAAYDWPNCPFTPKPEQRITTFLGSDLLRLPWDSEGCRNNFKWIEAHADQCRIEMPLFIKSLKYVTHVTNELLNLYLADFIPTSSSKTSASEEMVIRIESGRLHDHLMWSHVPRIAKSMGVKSFKIAKDSAFDNDDVRQIWASNPYCDGFSDDKGLTAPTFSATLPEFNALDYHMLSLNLDDGKRLHEPEFFYKPKMRPEWRDLVVFDPNFDIEVGDISADRIRRFIESEGLAVDVEVAPGSRHHSTGTPSTLAISSLSDYCDLIYSAKQFLCLASSSAAIAAALGKPSTVFFGQNQPPGNRSSRLHQYVLA